METAANTIMREYAKLYYGDPLTSVYFFETGDNGFGASFLIKNELDATKGIETSIWDSIHSFTVSNEGANVEYTLVSTVFLHIKYGESETGKVSVAGTSTKKMNKTFPATKNDKEHIERMGAMLEDNESDLRS